MLSSSAPSKRSPRSSGPVLRKVVSSLVTVAVGVSGAVVAVAVSGSPAAADRPCLGDVDAAAPGCAVSFLAPLDQSITFPQQADLYLTETQPRLYAAASSGLPVTYDELTPAVCTIYWDHVITPEPVPVIAPRAAGVCTVRAKQVGNAGTVGADESSYNAADPVEMSFRIKPDRLEQPMTFEYPVDMRLGDAPQVLTVSVPTGLPTTFQSLTPAVCAVVSTGDTDAVSALRPGLCKLQADAVGGFVGQDEYWSTFRRHELTVRPRLGHQQITFGPFADMRMGDGKRDLVASADSGLAVPISSDTPGVCKVGFPNEGPGLWVEVVAPGTCTLRAVQAGATTGTGGSTTEWPAALEVRRSFEVKPLYGPEQSIAFDSAAGIQAGTAKVRKVTASTGLPVTVTSSTPTICTVTPATAGAVRISAVSAGTCSLVASQAGGIAGTGDAARDYRPVSLTQELVVTPRSQTIRVSRARGVALSSGRSPVRFESTAGLSVHVTTSTPKVCVPRSGAVVLRGPVPAARVGWRRRRSSSGEACRHGVRCLGRADSAPAGAGIVGGSRAGSWRGLPAGADRPA